MLSCLSHDDECHHGQLMNKTEPCRDSHFLNYGISRLTVDRFSCEPLGYEHLAKNFTEKFILKVPENIFPEF